MRARVKGGNKEEERIFLLLAGCSGAQGTSTSLLSGSYN